jgi:hypothetical protein
MRIEIGNDYVLIKRDNASFSLSFTEEKKLMIFGSTEIGEEIKEQVEFGFSLVQADAVKLIAALQAMHDKMVDVDTSEGEA